MPDLHLMKTRTNALLDLAGRVLASKETETATIPRQRVDPELFLELRSAGLSLILKLVGEQHPYYREFDRNVLRPFAGDVERARGILKAIRSELDAGLIS